MVGSAAVARPATTTRKTLGQRLRLVRARRAGWPNEDRLELGSEAATLRIVTTLLRDASQNRLGRRLLAELGMLHGTSALDDGQVARELARTVRAGRIVVLARRPERPPALGGGPKEEAADTALGPLPEDWTLSVSIEVEEAPALVSRITVEPTEQPELRSAAHTALPRRRTRSRVTAESPERSLRSRATAEP